jgi:hypothetical protein
MYPGADNGQTEDADRKIREPQNIGRVLNERGDCSIVILCWKEGSETQEPGRSGNAFLPDILKPETL